MFWSKSKSKKREEKNKDHPLEHVECTCKEGLKPCSVSCSLRQSAKELDDQIEQKRRLREKVRRVTKEIEETPHFLLPVRPR